MSLLSEIQGRPERIRSLISVLKGYADVIEYRGPKEDSELKKWLLPKAFIDKGGSETVLSNTVGCATSLGLIKYEDNKVILLNSDIPVDIDSYIDYLHGVLIDPPNDYDKVLFYVYAYFILRTEEEGTFQWIHERNNQQIASDINDKVKEVLKISDKKDSESIFNSTKYAPWKSWMSFLGLGWDDGKALPSFYPSLTTRLEREIIKVGEQLGFNTEITAEDFINSLAKFMPYIDRGRIFDVLAPKMGIKLNTRKFSILLSRALRELHDDGIITLQKKISDDRLAIDLATDNTHPIRSISKIIIEKGE
jgi:hypothetical protein